MSNVEYRKEAVTQVPPFKSVEEEAEYWDTHSVLEAIDKDSVVVFHRAQKTGTLTVRFDPEDIERLRDEAHQRGVGPTTLVRMWVLEHLRELKTPSSAP